MLKTLKFVMGAVAKKDFLPAMTHFRIQNGTVRSFNGVIAISAPIDIDLDCIPKAQSLYKAISKCDSEQTKMAMTPAGRLSIRSGSFKALVDCVPEQETPHTLPEGPVFEVQGEVFMAAIKAVFNFIGDDAARPWSNGVLFRGQSAFATNNVCIVEYWTGINFRNDLNIPIAAIKEMIRVGEPPSKIQLGEGNITFHYSGDRWIRTQLISTDWPDVSKILNRQSTPKAFPVTFFEELEKLNDFTDKTGAVHFLGDIVSTLPVLDEGESGASVMVLGVPDGQIFNLPMLMLLKGVAQNIDFSGYPGPCMFYGDRLRGALMGMRNKRKEPENEQS